MTEERTSLALHFFLDACLSNVFDLSAVYIMLDQMKQYMNQKLGVTATEQDNKTDGVKDAEEVKHDMKARIEGVAKKENAGTYTVLGDIKLPGLNSALAKYGATHGISGLKTVMRRRFKRMPAEYFLTRPIDKEFLVYTARDVEDLVEVKENMVKSMQELLTLFMGNVEEGKAELLCKDASKVYGMYGCRVFREDNESNEQDELSD